MLYHIAIGKNDYCKIIINRAFQVGSVGKESTCTAGDVGSTPGSGRSPEGGHGNPLQYCCLENPMDRGKTSIEQSWEIRGGALMPCNHSRATGRRKSPFLTRTQPSQLPFLLCISILVPLLLGELVCDLQWLQTLSCNFLLILNKPIFVAAY